MSDPNYKGPDVNPKLENGPIEERGCTDIICCCVFLLFVAGLFVVLSTGLAMGHPEYLMAVYDATGKPCGLKPIQTYEEDGVTEIPMEDWDNTDYKFLYFWNP